MRIAAHDIAEPKLPEDARDLISIEGAPLTNTMIGQHWRTYERQSRLSLRLRWIFTAGVLLFLEALLVLAAYQVHGWFAVLVACAIAGVTGIVLGLIIQRKRRDFRQIKRFSPVANADIKAIVAEAGVDPVVNRYFNAVVEQGRELTQVEADAIHQYIEKAKAAAQRLPLTSKVELQPKATNEVPS